MTCALFAKSSEDKQCLFFSKLVNFPSLPHAKLSYGFRRLRLDKDMYGKEESEHLFRVLFFGIGYVWKSAKKHFHN